MAEKAGRMWKTIGVAKPWFRLWQTTISRRRDNSTIGTQKPPKCDKLFSCSWKTANKFVSYFEWTKYRESAWCREIEFSSSFWMFNDHWQFVQLVRPQIINKVSKQCRSLPVLFFMAVNSTSLLSAALINHRPWPLLKDKEVQKTLLRFRGETLS